MILVVFLLRSFLVEPFKIPSGSMLPTLLVGDFILVNKFTYGIRLPIINAKVADVNQPRRGEVMVFRYPENPALDYIKRVVGLPGDRIAYRNKRLWINDEEIKVKAGRRLQLHRVRAQFCLGSAHDRNAWRAPARGAGASRRPRRASLGGAARFHSGKIAPTMTRASVAPCHPATTS